MTKLFALAIAVALTPALAGCPQAVPATVATLETAICVLNTYSADKAAGQSDGQAIADTSSRCATDASTIATILDASSVAQARLASRAAK